MMAEDVPEGAARFEWKGPGREYDSGVLRQIAGAGGSWKNPYEYDRVNVEFSSMVDGTPAMIVDRVEPQNFQTEVRSGSSLVPPFALEC